MKNKKNSLALSVVGVMSLLACQSAMSVSVNGPTFADHNETSGYIAFQWFIGETSLTKPNVVLGLRQTTTDISNKVTGYDVSYTYSLEKSTSDAFRIGYLEGKCHRGLATAGLGYSFKMDTFLGFAGVVGSYAKAFGEIDGNKNLGAGLELNTLHCAGDRSGSVFTPVPGLSAPTPG